MSAEDVARYYAACHAMQSGVAFEQQAGSPDVEPKHLRVGVNTALCDAAGLVGLLIAKGIFTQDEYEKALAGAMELEVKRYEARAASRGFPQVTFR